MFNIVLFEPRIPPNTGNIIRLAANTGSTLHLIEPLGFSLDERRLRRAGLDYHEYSMVRTHADWETFLADAGQARVYGFSTKGETLYSNAEFRGGDYLLFGPETRGLPAGILESAALSEVLTLPMGRQGRSLNLSNAVAVSVYEAWRQQGFAGSRQAKGTTAPPEG